jgi:hypothetical protein
MIKLLSRATIAGCFAALAILGADVSGKWTAEMKMPNGNSRPVTMTLKADGTNLTGSVSGRNGDTPISDGKVNGDDVSFTVVREFNGNQMKMNYKGKVQGDKIHFTVTREGGEGQGMEMDATRSTT